MKTVDDIIQAFGGLQEFARVTGIKYPTVVAFKTRNRLPIEHWKTVEHFARVKKIRGLDRRKICDIELSRFPDVKVESDTPSV